MFKFIILFILVITGVYSADYGIFPTPEQLGLTHSDYWNLIGFLGIVSGYIFWEKVFR